MLAVTSYLSAITFTFAAGDLSAAPEWMDNLSDQLHDDWGCVLMLLGNVSEHEKAGKSVTTSLAICRDSRVFEVEGPDSLGRFVLVAVPEDS